MLGSIRNIAFARALASTLLLVSADSGAGQQPTLTEQPALREASVVEGMLAGVTEGDVVSFKGIPYAAPPVGELRWRPPQPAKPWAGVRPAANYGAICEQKYNAKDNGVGQLPKSEDCLTLNVFAPTQGKPAPVMVWIHGGGFVNGSGTAELYDGSALARLGVVVVTLNYRLGRFGFFAHPALTAEAGSAPVGNFGLMDMIAALKWVQANIASFGGDPRKVTIFGESAGGIAVNDLMVSPAARGLFSRAIVQSGLGRERTLTLQAGEEAGMSFAASVGIPGASAHDLRRLSAEDILRVGDPDILANGITMTDGQILPASPIQAFAAGSQARVAYIVGFTSLEFPISPSGLSEAFDKAAPADQRERIAGSYPTPESFQQHVISDILFNEPALALARFHTVSGQPTWVYQFSVLSASAAGFLKGAPHASERQYVFQTLNASPWPTDANDAIQSQVMSAYWASFAKTGDPNQAGRPQWPRYDGERMELLDFANDGPHVAVAPRTDAMRAISAMHAADAQSKRAK